jgi:hypothetical protein
MAAMRPDTLKPCARCGSQFTLAHSGQRYCSTVCYAAARREYQRVWARANKGRPAREPAKPRIDGDWRRARDPRRSRSGCGVIIAYLHVRGRYRIEHYLSLGELPFVALRLPNEMVGRYATLDEAKAACKRHKPEPRFNSQGDPVISRPASRPKKKAARRTGRPRR